MEYTPEQQEAIKQANEKLSKMDNEDYHRKADDILCELLKAFGCDETVVLFENIPKWYE